MRARRVDANHAAIRRAFEKLGCSVIDVSQVPCGFDLLVGFGGLCMPVEVKDGAKPPSRRKLTPNEQRVLGRWTGGARLVINFQDVILTVNALRLWRNAISAAALAKVGEQHGDGWMNEPPLNP